ncbi:MAG: AAA family ATPase [Pseudomonadales bacterium]
MPGNRPQAPYKPVPVPETFLEHYTQDDRQLCIKILNWLANNEKSVSWLAKLSRMAHSTLYRSVKGEYKTDPAQHLKKAMDAIRTQASRNSINEVPFVPTTVSEIAWAACKRARRYRSFAILTGFVGTGKTRSLKEYQWQHENTLMIEADPGMAVASLLNELVQAAGCSMVKHNANQHTKFKAILDELTDTDTLLIIDEAETLTPKALHYLRRIRDKARVGIVLSGTEALAALIKPEHGEFDQIRSRVNFWPNTAHGIKREDAEAIISISFADLGDLDDAISERLWQYCKGSMRMLVEELIPAIRDYGLPKHALSVELIDSVASKVLNLKKPA